MRPSSWSWFGASPRASAIARLRLRAARAASLPPRVNIKVNPSAAWRCISSALPREARRSIASSARSDQRRHSVSSDIARKIGAAAAASAMPMPTSPLAPKHQSSAARTLLSAAEMDARARRRSAPSPIRCRPAPAIAGSRSRGGRPARRSRRRLDLEQIGARRVEQTVAHHGADRARSRPSIWRRGCRWRSNRRDRSTRLRRARPRAPRRW